MSTPDDSLLDPAGRQLPLIPSEELRDDLFLEVNGRNPDFTAARFFSRFPDRYREIASLRAEGISIAAIARQLHVSRNTVAAIDRREAGSQTVEHLKQRAIHFYRWLTSLSAERLQEVLLETPRDKLTPQQLAVVIGVLEDKIANLSGQATSRIEVVDRPDVSAYEQLLEKARQAHEKMSGSARAREQKDLAAGEVEVGPPRPPAAGDPAAGQVDQVDVESTEDGPDPAPDPERPRLPGATSQPEAN